MNNDNPTAIRWLLTRDDGYVVHLHTFDIEADS